MVIEKIKIIWYNHLAWLVNLLVKLALFILKRDKDFMTLLDDVRETEDINNTAMTANTESITIIVEQPSILKIPKPKPFDRSYLSPNYLNCDDRNLVLMSNTHNIVLNFTTHRYEVTFYNEDYDYTERIDFMTLREAQEYVRNQNLNY